MTASDPRSPGVVREAGLLSRAERSAALGRCGAVVWLTGLPASGKSTLATALEVELVRRHARPAYRLDGDNLRHGLCGDLGFSAEDRAENVRRVGHAAAILADSGVVALVGLISPYAADRAGARAHAAALGLPFIEVHVDTPLGICERRDPKGLYARARAGTLRGMTGVDDPYEAPVAPEVVVDGTAPLRTSVAAVLAALAAAETRAAVA